MGVILNLTQSVDDVVAVLSIHLFSIDNNEMRVKVRGIMRNYVRAFYICTHGEPGLSGMYKPGF